MAKPTPTKQDAVQAVKLVMAIADCIREAREIPSGELYAMVMGKVSLANYEGIIGILTNAGLVSESSHLLRWIGPTEVKA